MLLIALTLSEAASILGVSPNASKAEINTAYRDAITKYHPDANRSKSPEEQKRAEQMFKQVGTARKVMLNPASAAPEENDFDNTPSTSTHSTSSPSSTANANAAMHQAYKEAQQQQQRQQQSYKASASSSQYRPQGHNTSTNFNNDVPRVVDPAEQQIADIYKDEARKIYLSASDKVRLTPSWATSLIFLVLSLAMFFMVPFTFGNLSLANPCLVMALICFVKIIIYDAFISYYLFKAIKKLAKGTWGILCGAEMLILGGIGTFLTIGSPLAPAIAPMVFGVLAGAGFIVCILSILISRATTRK